MTITLSFAAALAAFLGLSQDGASSQSHPPVVMASGEAVSFGNDDGEYPGDGECDDPRFVGDGMASSTDTANIGGDATDCASHYERGNIRLAMGESDFDVSQCEAIDFGLDTSEYARDRECDDPRFAGPGTDDILQINDLRGDATDCKRLCESGEIWLK